MRKKLFLIVVMLINLVTISDAYEVGTHKLMNIYISKSTINDFSFDLYLKEKLGMKNGREEVFSLKKSWEWLEEGGTKEDDYASSFLINNMFARYVNHFHNPLDNSGFSGVLGLGYGGVSSIEWSQKPAGTQTPGGYYSWHDVRGYYYSALTASDSQIRETNFAQTFRGLGQLMHLVQDLSVPEHTRDDGHVMGFEKWVLKSSDSSRSNTIFIEPGNLKVYGDSIVDNIKFFDVELLGNASSLAFVPIANLFDNEQYDGTNPSITMNNNVGLSEYTNTNFFSPDTFFNSGTFPYPAWSSVETYEEIDPSTGRFQKYLRKINDGETVEHLAALFVYDKYISSPVNRNYLILDDQTYADYAKKLLPRAIGYSSQILSYFFRGDMALRPDNETNSGYVIINNHPKLAMNGTFEIFYDNETDIRKRLYVGDHIIENADSGFNRSSNVDFEAPDDAKEPGAYMLVFKGVMDNETNAVVGYYKPAQLMWARNPNDHSVWSFDGTNWEKIDDGPGWEWGDAVWAGTRLIVTKQNGSNPEEIWSFDGNVWEKLDNGQYAVHQPIWTGTEIWYRDHVGSVNQDLVAYNPLTDTWRQVATYYESGRHPRLDDPCGSYPQPGYPISYTERFTQCWDGSQVRDLFVYDDSTRYPTWRLDRGRQNMVPYWINFNETSGVSLGQDLEKCYDFSCSKTPFLRFSKLVWGGSQALTSGDPSWDNPDFADYPVLASDGLDNYKFVNPGPGFRWNSEVIFTGKEVIARNDNDNSVWSFNGADWTWLSDFPGFVWQDAVFVGELKTDGTPAQNRIVYAEGYRPVPVENYEPYQIVQALETGYLTYACSSCGGWNGCRLASYCDGIYTSGPLQCGGGVSGTMCRIYRAFLRFPEIVVPSGYFAQLRLFGSGNVTIVPFEGTQQTPLSCSDMRAFDFGGSSLGNHMYFSHSSAHRTATLSDVPEKICLRSVQDVNGSSSYSPYDTTGIRTEGDAECQPAIVIWPDN